MLKPYIYLFIYLGFYVAFNTVQVISRRVVGRAEETSTYSSLGLCTVNCQPTASNYQLSHLRPSRGSNPGLRDGRRVLPLCHRGPLKGDIRQKKNLLFYKPSLTHNLGGGRKGVNLSGYVYASVYAFL